MKIAILGYGKMGRIIEKFANERGHDVVLKVNVENTEDLTIENLQKADVAIDFSTPDSALSNIELCFDAHVPVVVGTTGWYGQSRSQWRHYAGTHQSPRSRCAQTNGRHRHH